MSELCCCCCKNQFIYFSWFKFAKCKSSSHSLTYLFFKVWMPSLLHVSELVKKAELCSCWWWSWTMMILVLFFTCNVFLFGLHCTDHGPQTKKLSVRYLDDLMILVAVKMMQEVSSIGMAKWKFGSGYQITWRLTCACYQSWSSTSCCCSHGLNTIQSHAPVQSSTRSSQPSEKQNKPTHTHKSQLEESIHLATFVQQASLDDVCSWWEP